MRGGAFVYVDFHPAAWVFDEQGRAAYPYSSNGAITDTAPVGDYVARSGPGLVPWGFEPGVQGFVNPHQSASYSWGLGDIVQALLDAGLRLERLVEYPYTNGCPLFEGMTMDAHRRFHPPPGFPAAPLMFGLRARR